MTDVDRSTVVVTGAAGFIGCHAARARLDSGRRVVGIDNLNAYYPPALKRARLKPRIYNIGNNQPVALMRFIEAIEKAVGREAVKIFEPMQPGDVQSTSADIEAMSADYGFAPTTPLEDGIAKFTTWYRAYRKTKGAAPTP